MNFSPENRFANTATVRCILDAALWAAEAAHRASELPMDEQSVQDAVQSAQAALERADATLKEVSP